MRDLAIGLALGTLAALTLRQITRESCGITAPASYVRRWNQPSIGSRLSLPDPEAALRTRFSAGSPKPSDRKG